MHTYMSACITNNVCPSCVVQFHSKSVDKIQYEVKCWLASKSVVSQGYLDKAWVRVILYSPEIKAWKIQKRYAVPHHPD